MDLSESLVLAAKEGNVEALHHLAESVWPQLFRIAYGITRSRATAEDATQEACAVILGSIGSLRRANAFRTWAIRIVVREARRAMRHELAQIENPIPDVRSNFVPELIDIAQALSQLPAKQREVVVLRYFADLNSKEIGEALEMPRGTVRFHLFLARRSLASLLAADYDSIRPSSQERTRDAF